MRALVKTSAAPGLELIDVPEPQAGINDVTIRVLRTGICGTDLHIESWDAWAAERIRTPLVIGHEFVGEVVAVGSNVNDFHEGDIVSGEGHLVCGRCRNCLAGRRHLCAHTSGLGIDRAGCFARYVTLPMSNVWRHGSSTDGVTIDRGTVNPGTVDGASGLSLDVAAIFDPFGNAVHTALQFPVLGEDVLITGAGPIGLMATAVARHAGARFVVVTDVNPFRLDIARRMGATVALDIRSDSLDQVQRELGMTEGFDIGLEMSGHPSALPSMVTSMAHGGRIAMLGIAAEPVSIDWNTVVFNMLTIRGVYGREMYETWYAMTVMLQSGLDVTPVITHRFPASEHREAFAAAARGDAAKVVLDWDLD